MQLPLAQLHRRFSPAERYRSFEPQNYSLLPTRFTALDSGRHVLTNLVGEHLVASRDLVARLVRHQLTPDDPEYDELKSRHFLVDGESSVALDLLAVKYRTKQSALAEFTSLFMFVATLRCDHSCPYCQVSRQSADRARYDMSEENASRAIDFMFRTPSPSIKVEFQGGESLLNFALVRYIVEEVERRNVAAEKDVAFVIATNLALLADEHLDFCKAHGICISTSLDGPASLHDANRPRPGRDSHARAVDGIERARQALGHDRVSALMTTTRGSLTMPREIVEEYARLGFRSIFLRSISPYGFAVRTGWADDYCIADWLEFYKAGLKRVIELNREGVPMREELAAILLTKILTPWPNRYVDLQSPAGIAIAGIVFNYDGGIYASDEARMLAEMGDQTFRLGHLNESSYEDVMRSPALLHALTSTMAEGVPMCSDCAYQPYCGSDPVFHHATQGDMVGFKPLSAFCRKNMGVIGHLIGLLEDDPETADVLRSWL